MRVTRIFQSLFAALAMVVLSMGTGPAAPAKKKPRILCLMATGGFRHKEAIDTSKKVLPEMAKSSGAFEIDITEKTDRFTKEGLAKYDAVFFSNTTGDFKKFPLDETGRTALIDFVKGGGAFIGTHSSTDTYKDWQPYWEMIGGSFDAHPWNAGDPAVTIDVEDPSHPSTLHLDTQWVIQDEIYAFRNYSRDRLHVILSLNESALKRKNLPVDTDVPIAWCKNYGKGRVFYTSLGHRGDVWTNPVYQTHLLGGIRWALSSEPFTFQLGHPKRAGSWERIFDGKTLAFGTDWETTDNSAETRKHWTVQPGGILQGYWEKDKPGAGSSHIYYIKRPFRNFEYRAEVRLNPGGNSGMYFRCPRDKNYLGEGNRKTWKNWPNGDEAQVKVGPGDPKKTGTLYPGYPAVSEKELNEFLGVDTSKESVWVTQHVITVEDRIIIKLNGKIIRAHTRGRDNQNGWGRKEGLFAYQFHHKGTRVQYRNIEVRELFD